VPDKTPGPGVGVYVTGPNCWKCHYFAVSWDHTKPYACNHMGFKSRLLPALEVLAQATAKPSGARRKRSYTQMWEA